MDLSQESEPEQADQPVEAVIEPPPSESGSERSRRPRPVFLLVGLVVATALGIGLFTSFHVGTSGPAVTGRPAPGFSLPRLGGGGPVGTPSDGGGGGKPAVLIFFASWCPPCQAELPAVTSVYRHQQASTGGLSRVAFIGVDGLDPTPNALAFVHKDAVTFPVGVDADYNVTEDLYGFIGPPEAVFINGNGTIVHIQHGAITASQLVHWEKRLTA